MKPLVHSTPDTWDTTTCGKRCDDLPPGARVLSEGKAPKVYAEECEPCPDCYPWEVR